MTWACVLCPNVNLRPNLQSKNPRTQSINPSNPQPQTLIPQPRLEIVDYGLCSAPLDPSVDRMVLHFPAKNGEDGGKGQTIVQPVEHEWMYMKTADGVCTP